MITTASVYNANMSKSNGELSTGSGVSTESRNTRQIRANKSFFGGLNSSISIGLSERCSIQRISTVNEQVLKTV